MTCMSYHLFNVKNVSIVEFFFSKQNNIFEVAELFRALIIKI